MSSVSNKAKAHLGKLGKWCKNFKDYLDKEDPKLSDNQSYEVSKNIEAIGVVFMDTVNKFPKFPKQSIKHDIDQYKATVSQYFTPTQSQTKKIKLAHPVTQHDTGDYAVNQPSSDNDCATQLESKNLGSSQQENPSDLNLDKTITDETANPNISQSLPIQMEHAEPDSNEFYQQEPNSINDWNSDNTLFDNLEKVTYSDETFYSNELSL